MMMNGVLYYCRRYEFKAPCHTCGNYSVSCVYVRRVYFVLLIYQRNVNVTEQGFIYSVALYNPCNVSA